MTPSGILALALAVALALAPSAGAAESQLPPQRAQAQPQPQPPPARITLAVGQTAEREVGYAMGSLCDDPAIVRAEMKPKREHVNALVVTGLAVGTTLCRAGTDPNRPFVLFEIVVVARR